MARQQVGQANQTFGEAQDQYKGASGNAGSLYSQLLPQFTNEVNNPQGFGAPTVAGMKTNAEQSVGGSVAGAVGQGNLTAARTRNIGGNSTALDNAVRSGQQTLSGADLDVDAANAQLKQQQQQAGLSGLSGLYGQNQSTMLSALGLGNQATQTGIQAGQNGWFQNLMSLTSQGAQVGAAALCPARGSLYLMADETERPVENLRVGDLIAGIDGEPEVIQEIQSAMSPVLHIRTEDGFETRNSRVHAFALPSGGFVVAMFSLGKTIRTANGESKVVSVAWDGNDEVFNVITDGSHTYRADGVWALGVGEAERQVSMNRWNEIGDRLTWANA